MRIDTLKSHAGIVAPASTHWLRALLVLVAIKAAWLCCDAIPRLFLGDSASYLYAAANAWMPPDRSFTYPWLLHYLVMPWQSPYALIVVQSMAGVASAWLLWSVLRRRFGVGEWIALLTAALFACDPAQVFYERMVMAEAFGGLMLMAAFAATVEYVATARIRWLVALEICGLAAVSLRMNLLPVVLVMGAVAPLLLFLQCVEMRRVAAHLLCAIALLYGLNGGYRHFVSNEFNTSPAWTARSGMMELGLVAPLVKPAHLVAENISPELLDRVQYKLSDPDLRNQQMWSPHGLIDVLGASASSSGDILAGRIARHAIHDDPFGLVRLDIHNLGDYFNTETAHAALRDDLASNRPYTDAQAIAHSVLNTSVEATRLAESPAWRWFRFGAPWLVACWLALPLLGALACRRLHRNGRTAMGGVLLLYALGLPVSHFLFLAIPSYRYLHSMPAFALIAIAVLSAPRIAALNMLGHATENM